MKIKKNVGMWALLCAKPRTSSLLRILLYASVVQTATLIVMLLNPHGFGGPYAPPFNHLSRVAETFEIERRFAAELVGKNFYFGFGNESDDGTDLPSGFLVTTPQFSEKLFVLTASHVVSMAPYEAFKNQFLSSFRRMEKKSRRPVN